MISWEASDTSHQPMTLCVTLLKGRGRFVWIPSLCFLKEALVMAKHSVVSCDPERFQVVSEGWLVQASSSLIHLPLKTRLLSYIPSVTTSHLLSFRSPFGFCYFNPSFRTSFMSPAVSQSLYPLSPRVASPRRLGHMLFCLAQVSHIPDIIGRTPVSLVDSHLRPRRSIA